MTDLLLCTLAWLLGRFAVHALPTPWDGAFVLVILAFVLIKMVQAVIQLTNPGERGRGLLLLGALIMILRVTLIDQPW